MSTSPRVLLLDGDADNSLTIAAELSEALDATVIGAGTMPFSRLLRSRYCDERVTLPPVSDQSYGTAVLDALERHGPDFVLPVGYRSTIAIAEIRTAIPDAVSTSLPSASSLRTAADKAATRERGRAVGFDVPAEYTDVVSELDATGRPRDGLSALPFPCFIKARHETGDTTTARVDRPAAFWAAYDRIARQAPNGEVIVQECIGDSSSTFGCGVLILDGEVELTFGHEELRSVPRRGGSGTHLRVHRDAEFESTAVELLEAFDWETGVALVECVRRADGSYALLEINPKLWASYALASRNGYRFASTMVADALGLDVNGEPERVNGPDELVYPLRELNYCARNPEATDVRRSIATLVRPEAAWSVDPSDLSAWLTPPSDLLGSLGSVRPRLCRSAQRACARSASPAAGDHRASASTASYTERIRSAVRPIRRSETT
ncbi:ATP-dependent carboxylate-amine ligase [Halovivax limisalsi]|uniref:ATP-dependent carboxylate-amine ligase n=1 Tax=Halovivax limisalsi TaxID=1453760 RepID=UPI001FFD8875|nr:ATP-dependent carboxylate-amine ligase [Halovivax limisalsi]